MVRVVRVAILAPDIFGGRCHVQGGGKELTYEVMASDDVSDHDEEETETAIIEEQRQVIFTYKGVLSMAVDTKADMAELRKCMRHLVEVFGKGAQFDICWSEPDEQATKPAAYGLMPVYLHLKHALEQGAEAAAFTIFREANVGAGTGFANRMSEEEIASIQSAFMERFLATDLTTADRFRLLAELYSEHVLSGIDLPRLDLYTLSGFAFRSLLCSERTDPNPHDGELHTLRFERALAAAFQILVPVWIVLTLERDDGFGGTRLPWCPRLAEGALREWTVEALVQTIVAVLAMLLLPHLVESTRSSLAQIRAYSRSRAFELSGLSTSLAVNLVCEVVMYVLIYRLFSQESTPMDITLNLLAVTFLVDIDNFVANVFVSKKDEVGEQEVVRAAMFLCWLQRKERNISGHTLGRILRYWNPWMSVVLSALHLLVAAATAICI